MVIQMLKIHNQQGLVNLDKFSFLQVKEEKNEDIQPLFYTIPYQSANTFGFMGFLPAVSCSNLELLHVLHEDSYINYTNSQKKVFFRKPLNFPRDSLKGVNAYKTAVTFWKFFLYCLLRRNL